MSLRIAAILTVAFALPAAARADDGWSKTFSADAVGSYFDGKPAALVVGAGASDAALAEAAGAFESALRASGKAGLVMNGKSLGDVGDLDDPKIVAKAAALPVSLVVVVRVFEEPKAPASAVVTVYDKKAEVQFAVSATVGTPLAAKATTSGVSAAAAKSVAEATLASGGGKSKAQEQFDEKAVFFEDYQTVGMNEYGAVVSTTDWTQAYQGKYKKPLAGAAFYEAVGHPEMAEHYRAVEAHNTTWAWISGGVAAALFAGGTVMWIGAIQGDEPNQGALLAGVLISTLAPELVGGAICYATHQNPDSVDGPGARKLADEYNQKLKRDLGLDESADSGGSGPHLVFGIAPVAGGGVAGVAGSF